MFPVHSLPLPVNSWPEKSVWCDVREKKIKGTCKKRRHPKKWGALFPLSFSYISISRLSTAFLSAVSLSHSSWAESVCSTDCVLTKVETVETAVSLQAKRQQQFLSFLHSCCSRETGCSRLANKTLLLISLLRLPPDILIIAAVCFEATWRWQWGVLPPMKVFPVIPDVDPASRRHQATLCQQTAAGDPSVVHTLVKRLPCVTVHPVLMTRMH